MPSRKEKEALALQRAKALANDDARIAKIAQQEESIVTAEQIGVMDKATTGTERTYVQGNPNGNQFAVPSYVANMGGPNLAGKAGFGGDTGKNPAGSLIGDPLASQDTVDARLIQYGSTIELKQRIEENAVNPNPNIPQTNPNSTAPNPLQTTLKPPQPQ